MSATGLSRLAGAPVNGVMRPAGLWVNDDDKGL